jgi:hypothetical protein
MKTRDRLVLGIVALAGLMAVLWLGVLAPKREKAAGLADKVTAAETRRDAANTKATAAAQARTTYNRDYAAVARLGKATPPDADEPSLVYQIESAARHAKVDFRSVSVESTTPSAPAPAAPAPDPAATGGTSTTGTTSTTASTGITPVPFTFTFEGSFLKLHALLRSVDNFALLHGQKVKIKGRLLTLDAVKLTPGRKGFPQVKVDVTARAYVAPIPDQLPSSSAPTTAGSTTPSTATQVTK